MTLEEKVKQYEQEIADMKEKVLYDCLIYIQGFRKQKFESSLSTVLKLITIFVELKFLWILLLSQSLS